MRRHHADENGRLYTQMKKLIGNWYIAVFSNVQKILTMLSDETHS